MTTHQTDWCPDRACEEMAELFKQADQIISQPHYQEDASADSLDGSSADPNLTTAQQSQGLTKL